MRPDDFIICYGFMTIVCVSMIMWYIFICIVGRTRCYVGPKNNRFVYRAELDSGQGPMADRVG